MNIARRKPLTARVGIFGVGLDTYWEQFPGLLDDLLAKKEILKLKKARKRIEQDAVKGSSHEFPYTPQTFHIEGLAYPVVKDPDELDRLEEILKERLQTAERIKHDVEAWLNTIPQRMQRIIRYKIFEELTWSEVAVRMGRKATADGVRMEYIRFMEEK